ncbi:MAG: hypothetical protein ABI970_01940, partial [Chloroflexota bacterium]
MDDSMCYWNHTFWIEKEIIYFRGHFDRGHIFVTHGLVPDPTLSHVDSIRTSEHVYNLAKHNATYDGIGHNYLLYECDSLGIVCRAIYRYKQKTLNEAYADLDNPPSI